MNYSMISRENGHGIGYMEYMSLKYGPHTLNNMRTMVYVQKADNKVLVEILAEGTVVDFKISYVFFGSKPYFVIHFKGIWKIDDYGWNKQVAWLLNVTGGNNEPLFIATNEETHPIVSNKPIYSRFALRFLTDRNVQPPSLFPTYIIWSPNGIGYAIILVNFSHPLMEMYSLSAPSFQEIQVTDIIAQDALAADVVRKGHIFELLTINYPFKGNYSIPLELSQKLCTNSHFIIRKFQLPSGAATFYSDKYNYETLFSPTISYVRSWFKYSKFTLDLSALLPPLTSGSKPITNCYTNSPSGNFFKFAEILPKFNDSVTEYVGIASNNSLRKLWRVQNGELELKMQLNDENRLRMTLYNRRSRVGEVIIWFNDATCSVRDMYANMLKIYLIGSNVSINFIFSHAVNLKWPYAIVALPPDSQIVIDIVVEDTNLMAKTYYSFSGNIEEFLP
jgi:hypothetical protein